MEYLSALEISSKMIKLLVGFEKDNEIHIIYSLKKAIPQCFIDGRLIKERNKTLVENLENIMNIQDETARLKFKLDSVIYSMPPIGLRIELFRTNQGISSEDAVISKKDINGAYLAARNSARSDNKFLVDIVPDEFVLDDGQRYRTLPLGKVSRSIACSLITFQLPPDVISDNRNPIITAGLKIKRNVVANYGVVDLLANYPNMPKSYFLVDIGSNMTTVSLVGNGFLDGSTYFKWGGDNITEKIIVSFNINEADAEKYKILYGIDERKYAFRAPVCQVGDSEGNLINHYGDELNAIIKNELDIFANSLNKAINDILGEEFKRFNNIPLVLIGGGSQLHGLKEYLKNKVYSEDIRVIVPKTFGARDPSFFNCLGALYSYAKLPNIGEEAHANLGDITRIVKPE